MAKKKLIWDPFILDPSAYSSDFARVSSLPSLRHAEKRRALGSRMGSFWYFYYISMRSDIKLTLTLRNLARAINLPELLETVKLFSI